MKDSQITLKADEDPTIWGKCVSCSKTGLGIVTGKYFAKAYTPNKWKKDPTCENCNGPLVELYRVE